MANHKTGKNLICPNCSLEFYIPKNRIGKSKNHYCSLKCLSQFTREVRANKLRKKEYPFSGGICLSCSKDIEILNAQFDKPNRKFCSRACKTIYQNKKKIWTDIEKNKLAESARKRMTGFKWKNESKKKLSKSISMENHWNWKGGITPISHKERSNFRLKEWRRKVFSRDNYTCQQCGEKNGNGKTIMLNAHHIKRWSEFPKERYLLSNGITLCEQCHAKTDNYRGRGISTGKRIHQIGNNNQIIQTWDSIKDASTHFNISPSAIGNCLRGRTRSSAGYMWSYASL